MPRTKIRSWRLCSCQTKLDKTSCKARGLPFYVEKPGPQLRGQFSEDHTLELYQTAENLRIVLNNWANGPVPVAIGTGFTRRFVTAEALPPRPPGVWNRADGGSFRASRLPDRGG